METVNLKREVLEAEENIREYVRETPLEFSPYLSREGKCRAYLKLENFQVTGSFKLRGAANKLISLNQEERDRGIVTSSTGNHGAAVAYMLEKLGMSGTIYLPENANRAKVELLLTQGAELKYIGSDCVQAEIFAREAADESGRVFISPYNDQKVIGGQGTIGIELLRQARAFRGNGKIDTVLVPVGGGGLISGIAVYLKSMDAGIEVIGCQPQSSAVMYESIRAGKILQIESKPTISDGSAGGIEPGSVTFDICRKLVDDFILVTEDEIKGAIRLVLEKHYMLTEGAGALTVASFLKTRERFGGRGVVLILSGSKIGLQSLVEVLA